MCVRWNHRMVLGCCAPSESGCATQAYIVLIDLQLYTRCKCGRVGVWNALNSYIHIYDIQRTWPLMFLSHRAAEFSLTFLSDGVWIGVLATCCRLHHKRAASAMCVRSFVLNFHLVFVVRNRYRDARTINTQCYRIS